MSSKKLDFIPILLTCVGGCLIGLAPIFVRFSEIGPSFTGFYRFLFATILIFIYGILTKKIKLFSFKELLIISIPGLCFGTDIVLWHSSIVFTSIAHATLFVNTAPLYVCILGYIFFKDRLNNLFLISLLVCLSGVFILINNNPIFSGIYLSFGDSLALLAAFFYAGYLLAINKLSKKFNTFNLIFYSSFFACIPFGIASLFELDNPIPYSVIGWLNFLGQAVFVQILGQGLVIYGLSKIRPQLSSLLLLFQPITATILGAYFFSETLLIGQLIGVIILLIGIYLAGLSERLRETNER